jgi:uncharacterized protein
MNAYSLNNRHVVITGASSGIGRALSRRFAEAGAHCLLGAHPSEAEALCLWCEELQERYGVRVWPVPVDLALPDGPEMLYRTACQVLPRVDVLVNNAGMIAYGNFHDMETDRLDRLLMVNGRTYMILMRLFLKDMIRAGQGRILNVSSASAFQPTAHHAVYGAVKAFVQHMSEAVQQEIRGTGVIVCTLNPSYTDTPMLKGADFPKTLFWYRFCGLSDPDAIAGQGIDALIKGKPVYIPGLFNRLIHVFLPRLLPRRLAGYISWVVLRPVR